MIRSLPTHISQPARTKPAHAAGTPRTSAADFQKLLKPEAAPSAGLPASIAKPVGEVPHLGPFTGDPYMHPAVPQPAAPDPIKSSPYLPAGYPGDRNLMNKAEH